MYTWVCFDQFFTCYVLVLYTVLREKKKNNIFIKKNKESNEV